MPLHRDIHWLGRQWAVTGHGLQLINQKQMGYYDIEIARLWDDALIQSMQGKAWINRADFDKALELAQARFAGVVPTGEPPPAAPAAPPPLTTTPRVKPDPVEPPAVSTLEELLAKLKAKSAPSLKPAQVAASAPPEPEPPTAVPVALEGSQPAVPPPLPAAIVPQDPAPAARPKPVWVFDRKIAGSARFVRPWRARMADWYRSLPGLPPRP